MSSSRCSYAYLAAFTRLNKRNGKSERPRGMYIGLAKIVEFRGPCRRNRERVIFLRFQPLPSTGHTHPHTRKLITWARTWSHAANSGASDVPAVPSRANGGTAFCSCCSTLLRGRRRTRRAARRTQHQGRLRQLPQVRLDSRCTIGAMGPASEGSGRQQKVKSWVADWLAFDARTHVGSLRRYIT